MNRRSNIKGLISLFGLYNIPYPLTLGSNLSDNFSQEHPVFKWINQTTGTKPEIGWFSGEQYAYHEVRIKSEWQAAPEFFPFFDHPSITNRQFAWLEKDGLIYTYTEGDKLKLSGENAASEWLSEPKNKIIKHKDYTEFYPQSGLRLREAMVIPAFQFNIHQHPIWDVEIESTEVEYQLIVAIKGRAVKPLFCSKWLTGKQAFQVPIKELIDNYSYTLNYAQVHIALVVWKNSLGQKDKVKINLFSKTKEAVIVPLPVIRTLNNAPKKIRLYKADSEGKLQKFNRRISVQVGSEQMYVKNGNLELKKNPEGEYKINIEGTILQLKLTNGIHWQRSDDHKWKYDDRILTPLTGTYSSINHVIFDPTGEEKLIFTNQDYDKDKSSNTQYHFWESLTEDEMKSKISYLSDCGFDVLHMSQGWGFWQKLDNGGKISPFGAELFAQFYRIAANQSIYIIQALTHYPYFPKTDKDGWGSPPNEKYFEEGFSDSDWLNLGQTKFNGLFENYLRQFGSIFKDETALLMLSTSGEGDHMAGYRRCKWVEERMKKFCPKTLFYSEPIFFFSKTVGEHILNWDQKILGSRSYSMGIKLRSDYDLCLYFKLNNCNPKIVMAEGAFPAPQLYSVFMYPQTDERSKSWIGSEHYRIHVRDNIYIGLVTGSSLLLTWEEQFTEDERICLRLFREKLLLPYQPKQANVEVLYSEEIYKNRAETLGPLIEFALTNALGSIKLVDTFTNLSTLKIDPRTPLTKAQKNEWKKIGSLEVSIGYSCIWETCENNQCKVVYLYNTGDTYKHEVLYSKFHRIPKATAGFLKFGDTHDAIIMDLETKNVTNFKGNVFNIPFGTADYLIILQ